MRARASLKATEQPIDTGTAAGKCFLEMLGVFAEFETNLRRERQLEGIAKAKAAGVYNGRPASIDAARVRELKAQGMGAHGDCQGAQDRPRVRLSCIGGGPNRGRDLTDPLDPSNGQSFPPRLPGGSVSA
jgi:DNA invertase Pin-like site-specific DNA recombinase